MLSRPQKFFAACVVVALVAATLVLIPNRDGAGAAGTPDLQLTATVDADTLLGDTTEVTLEVSNASGTDGYNLSFNDVLPAGVSYSSGSVAPSQILTDVPSAGLTTLIWENVTDIPDGATQSITYELAHDDTIVSVGDTVAIAPGAYANSDPRFVPDFSPTTGAATGDFTGSDTDTGSTDIVPFRITKREPNAEAELLRGVHDHQTLFTLTVDNNFIDPSTGFSVEDYLPAGIEFLECGTADNSAGEEYVGSGVLNPGNAPTIPSGALEGCVVPTTVDTVNVDPDGAGPLPLGVYTHVTWDAAAIAGEFGTADLAASETMRLHYIAAIPQFANTMTWPSGEPTEVSGLQGSNLDNNTGPTTEETSEQVFTNYAETSATYTGDAAVYTVDDDEIVVSEDVSIHKSVDLGTISQGQTSVWTLEIETSEYVTLVDTITVTDTLPDGLCPFGAGGDCGAAPAPSHAFTGVGSGTIENADGTWTLLWDFDSIAGLGSMGRSETRTITYSTLTLDFYQEGGVDDVPIVAEDAWTNVVGLTADADGRAVTDASDADQEAGAMSVLKEIADPSAAPVTCGDGSGLTWQPVQAGPYVPGDRVCWRLTVDYPGDLDTLSSKVTDFLPAGFTYESYALSPTNTVGAGDISFDGSGAASGTLIWNLGDGSGYVDVGERFQIVVSTVISDPAAAQSGDLTENLMKYSFVNSGGELFPLRDDADAVWSEPELSVVKGVLQVTRGGPVVSGPHGSDVDNILIEGSDVVTYRVDVSNAGTTAASNTELWDLLPSEVTCTEVSTISSGGTCNVGNNRIEWTGQTVPASGSILLTYEVTMPATLGPNESLTNTAGVRVFETPINTGVSDTFEYYPASNVDGGVTPNTAAASDGSEVHSGSVTLSKTVASELTDSGNNGTDEATIGEEVTFTITATLPSGVTFDRNTSLTDVIDSRFTYVAASAGATLDGAPLPTAGLTLDDSGGTITVDVPDGYSTSAAETLIVTFDAQVDDDAANTRGSTIPNTAALAWESDITGVHSVNGAVNVTVVEPNITASKSNGAAGLVLPDDDISYTVSVTNDDGIASVSTAHQVTVIDTLPADLTPLSGGVPVTDGATVPPDSGTWSEGSRTITWTVLSIAPGVTVDLDYDARVANPLLTGSQLTNNVAVDTSSLPSVLEAGGERDDSSPHGGPGTGYQATAQSTVTAEAPTIAKSVAPTAGTVGDNVQYTIDVTIPAGLTAYDATVRDDLPSGLVFDGTASVACVEGGGACSPDIVPAEIGTTGTQVASWFLGDLTTAAAADRVVTIVVDAHVEDIPAVTAASTLSNSAVVMTNQSDLIAGTPPTPPTSGGFDEVSTPAVADLDIDEPTLSIDKDVSGQVADDDFRRVVPGQTLTYSLTVTNSGDHEAVEMQIDDAVDSRMLPVSIAAGTDNGVGWIVTDADPSDGDLNWLAVGPLAAGASFTITYQLQVPALTSVDEVDPGTELDNSADVSSYWAVQSAERISTGNTYREYDDVTVDTVGLEVDLASIGDHIWFDRDGDGVVDGDEPGLAGIDVIATYLGPDGVLGGGDDEIHIVTTDGNGDYLVSDLPDGNYRIAVDLGDLPAAMVPSYDLDGGTGAPDGVWQGALGANEDKTDVDFGFEGTGSIGDEIWFDRNGDGIFDGDEFGLDAVDVTITWFGPDGVAGGGDDAPFVVTTDVTGAYVLGGLPTGNYSVTVDTGDLPPGMTATYDLDGGTGSPDSAWTGSLAVSQTRTDVDFGYRGSGSIGDELWLDDNGDGIRDVGEQPLIGAIVQLVWAGEDAIAGNADDDTYTTTTDGSGNYLFDFLPPGDYVVSVTGGLPTAVANTYDEDLDLDSSTPVTLANGAAHLTADFGFEGTTGIGDLVWFDTNGDGVRDAGEPGLSGIEVTLTYAGPDDTFGNGDDVVLVENTDASGGYFFDNVPAGNHRVAITSGLPTGVTASYDEDGGLDDTTEVLGLADGVIHLTADFGYVGTGSVSDLVWLDINADGVVDAGEPGLAGVDVDIAWSGQDGVLGTGDDVVVTVTTDADGLYSLGGLPAGDVSVTVQTATLPGSTSPTYDLDATLDDTTTVTLTTGESRTDLDFGYVGDGLIGDLVWFDRDGDTIVDVDETGIEGVTIDLTWTGPDGVLGTGDDEVFSTTTGAAGDYVFTGMPDGAYQVVVNAGSLPPGFTQTHDETGPLDHTSDVSLVGGAFHQTADFGYVGAGSIGDLLWLDLDADGTVGVDEPALPGVTVELTWAGEDGVLGTADDDTFTTTTDAAGNYLFDGLPPGDHRVAVTGAFLGLVTNTHDEDSDLDSAVAVTLADGATHATADFGYRGDNSIGDFVWHDVDADGTLDVEEPALEAVEIGLTWFGADATAGTSDDVSWSTVLTDVDGAYLFENLPDGDYEVEVVAGVPAGYTETVDRDGTGAAADGRSIGTGLAGATGQLDHDFGYTGGGSIGDLVWLDLDADGVLDLDEPGLAGVGVTLTWFGPDGVSGGGDDIDFTTETDLNGGYDFDHLPPGVYRIVVDDADLPAGVSITADPDGGADHTATVTLGADEVNLDQDFGYVGPGTIGDLVFIDSDADGQVDTGESGIAGVEVTITYLGPDGELGGGDDLVFTLTTDADGGYSLGGLPEGDYQVRLVPPEGVGLAPNSDLDGGDPLVSNVSLNAGQHEVDVDFGLIGVASIACVAFVDSDNDGALDSGEVTLAGVEAVLSQDGNEVRRMTTTGDGAISFIGLMPGAYELSFVAPTGYASVDARTITTSATTHDCAQVGFVLAASGLPATGSDSGGLTRIGALLLLTGAALVVGTRQRRVARIVSR